ncbi:hypothetical protein INR49_001783 [Caranx melampygus]|nr:hypothetical protein INR49_001783 [Caranx melampygus]
MFGRNIQQAAERPERNFVDTRQLKVCATCFDLSVSLLRVLEMTVTLVPEIFLDWTRPSAELLLRRLAQLLNQVLNRVTAEKNLFDRVVNLRLPGLESVDHYPILVAVTGILVRILVDGDRQGNEGLCADLLCSCSAPVLISRHTFIIHPLFCGLGSRKLINCLFWYPLVRVCVCVCVAHNVIHVVVNDEDFMRLLSDSPAVTLVSGLGWMVFGVFRVKGQSSNGTPQEGSLPINVFSVISNIIVEMNKSISVLHSRISCGFSVNSDTEAGRVSVLLCQRMTSSAHVVFFSYKGLVSVIKYSPSPSVSLRELNVQLVTSS